MDLRATSVIRLNLAKNVIANFYKILIAKELWEKLEAMYEAKSISSQMYLKEQFYMLWMEEVTKILDHLGVLNDIIFELKVIRVKIYNEYTLKLMLSPLSSYEHMKPILMYGKRQTTSKHLLKVRKTKEWTM